VVQRVEAPECRPLVRDAMCRVQAELGDRECEDHLRGERPMLRPQLRQAAIGRIDGGGGQHRRAGDSHDRELDQSLGQQGVGQVRRGLAVGFQPLPFVRHPSFQHADHERERDIDHVEPQHRVAAGERLVHAKQAAAVEQRPQQPRQRVRGSACCLRD